MNGDLRALVDAGDGVVSRAESSATVPRHIVEYALRRGTLVRAFPGVYADPARLTEPRTRIRAALTYAGPDAALSHLTALAAWRLPGGTLKGPVHLLVDWRRRLRAVDGVVVHRRRGFVAAAPEVVVRAGFPTCRVERCVVDGWPLLPPDTGRAAAICAVGERRTTPARLLAAIDGNPSLPGRVELVRLVNLLARGCRSELELWGYEHIFTGPDLPALDWDVRSHSVRERYTSTSTVARPR